MDKIKTIIVEDEEKGMEKIVALLENHCPNIHIIEKCTNGKDAIQAINLHCPQLVFLDILLGDMKGFDVLSSVPHINFETIIITAYDEYGIKAVKAGILDYLLKPFNLDELKNAVHKAWNKIYLNKDVSITKIALPDSNGFNLIAVDNILYCQADDNCTKIYFKNSPKSLLVVKTMGKIYEQLPKDKFCRISRAHIINIGETKSYSKTDGGIITLSNKKVLPARAGVFRKDSLLRLKNIPKT